MLLDAHGGWQYNALSHSEKNWGFAVQAGLSVGLNWCQLSLLRIPFPSRCLGFLSHKAECSCGCKRLEMVRVKHLACFLAHRRCVAWQLLLLWSSSSACPPGWLGPLALVPVENLLREAGPDLEAPVAENCCVLRSSLTASPQP